MKTTLQTFLTLSFPAILLVGCGMPDVNSMEEMRGDSKVSIMRNKKLPIEYKIASMIPEKYVAEVQAGFESWNAATGVEIFKFGGIKKLSEDELSPDYTFDENVVLMTNRSGAILSGTEVTGAGGPLARTYLKGLGKIQDADIYLFEFDNNFVNGRPGTGDIYTLQSVVAHEAGHMLFGDQHSSDPESIMTPTLYPKGLPQEKYAPSESDVAHFFEVYGDML